MTRQNEKGFTLVEVLVAMVIFAFGILTVINMQLVASSTTLKARYITEGIVVATGKMEELSFMSYNAQKVTATNTDNVLTTAESSTLGETIEQELSDTDHTDFTHPVYKLGWNIVEETPYADTKTIRVIVKWMARDLKQSFSLDMVKSNGV